MSINVCNDRSMASITSFPSGVSGSALTLIKTVTASSSATISFVHGSSDVVLDSTYKEYIFKFINLHPSSDSSTYLVCNFSIDSGSNYNVTKTTTGFRAEHDEADSSATVVYQATIDLAQGTGFVGIGNDNGSDNDQATSGTLHLFDPSNTTFVKHFISTVQSIHPDNKTTQTFAAGYGNTTSAINAVQFKPGVDGANFDSGTIKLYGVS